MATPTRAELAGSGGLPPACPGALRGRLRSLRFGRRGSPGRSGRTPRVPGRNVLPNRPQKVIGTVVPEVAEAFFQNRGRLRTRPERAEIALEPAGRLSDRHHFLGVEDGGLELGHVADDAGVLR